MATNVRLKDAAGNVLHPETDWSVVQNKPNIIISELHETWSDLYLTVEGGVSLLLKNDNDEIKINDKETSYVTKSLSDYPIKWSAIKGRPYYINLFGYVSHSTSSAPFKELWPAVALRDINDNIKSVYQFNGNGWVSAPKDSFNPI